MPYIEEKDREIVSICTVGKLNYEIHELVNQYLDNSDRISYGAINDVMGVLECVKQELYRRLAVPYEERKLSENGDVPPYNQYT